MGYEQAPVPIDHGVQILQHQAEEWVKYGSRTHTAELWTGEVPILCPADALHAVADALLSDVQMYWSNPSEGRFWLGIGSAYGVVADGRTSISNLKSDVLSVRVVGDESAVWMGGLAFHPGHRREEWKDWRDAEFFVPQWLIRCERDRVMLRASLYIENPMNDESALVAWKALGAAISDMVLGTNGNLPLPDDVLAPVAELLASTAEKQHWTTIVTETVQDIHNGCFDKAVLARREMWRIPNHRLPGLIPKLELQYPTSYIFAFQRHGSVFVGASPEQLVAVRGEQVVADCLAGTTQRGSTPEEDQRLAQDLLQSTKDRREHEFVRQWFVACLKDLRVRELSAPETPNIRPFTNVQHLHTPIRAKRRVETSILDFVRALHPTPAVGGVPQQAAVACILAREQMDRGWYSGPIGWMTSSGEGQFVLALRCALITGNQAVLYAGAGIVQDSTPESEWAETHLKLDAVRRVLIP